MSTPFHPAGDAARRPAAGPPVDPGPGDTLSPAVRRRGLAVIFASTFLELSGYFMLMPLVTFGLLERGHGATMVGLVGAAMWAGILVATPLVARFVQRFGRIAALWVSALVPLVCALGLVLSSWWPVWIACAFVSGTGSALRWIVAEASVAEFAPPGRRGRWVGLFETMVGSTFVVGPALLAWTGAHGTLPLAVVLGLLVAGLVALLPMPRLPAGVDGGEGTPLGLRGVTAALRAHPAIMIAGFVGGFFESGVTGLLPVWGLALGWSVALAALLVSASGLGSSLAMIPVGELADRLGRRRVLMACASLTLAATAALPWVGAWPALAWAIALLWGGAGGALYTLAMIDIGDRSRGAGLMNATAVLVMAYTAGGLIAPLAGGALLEHAPVHGFSALAIAVAAAGWLALHRWGRLPRHPAIATRSAPGGLR